MPLALFEFPPKLPPDFWGIPLNAGRTHAVTVRPGKPEYIIVSMQFGGLWRTFSSGDTWYHVNGLPTTRSHDVQYGPTGQTVVATKLWDLRAVNGGGIWISRDGGESWSQPATGMVPKDLRTPERTSAWGIAKDPDDRVTWYVGTDFGIAISRDDGATWEHKRIDPTVPLVNNRMQDVPQAVTALPGGQVMAMLRSGIYRSDDRGATWRNVRSGDFSFFETVGWNKMDRFPSAPAVIALQTYEKLLLYELDLDRWTEMTVGTGQSRSPFVRIARLNVPIFGEYATVWIGRGVSALFCTRQLPRHFRNVGPEHWSIVGRAQGFHDDTGDLGLDGDFQPRMMGTDGGVFSPLEYDSIGNVATWQSAAKPGSGMNSYQITDIGGTNVRVDRKTQTAIYFSTQDNAVWASTDGGATWPRNDCCEGFHIEVAHTAEKNEKVTVGYGKVGAGPSGSMFADAGFQNQRAVPDVDESGTTLGGWSQAFYLKPKNWLRFRMPPPVTGQPAEPNEIRVSDDNGSRWRLRYTTTLGWAGPFQRTSTNYPSPPNRAYWPVFTGESNGIDTRGKIGLVGLFGPMANTVTTIGDSNIIRLPSDGSLGLRATEFDWQAVFAVDPRDWLLIIAPDIKNQRMMITRSAGLLWQENTQLTDLVLESGNLLMYKAPYHMQVTHIGFDPYDGNRILVGTRDAGIMQSTDRGETWSKIGGSERALYVTGFFFEPNSDVIVSTYGRGLFRLSWAVGCTLPLLTRIRQSIKLQIANEAIDAELAARDSQPPEEDDRMPEGFDNPRLPRILLSTDLPPIGVPTVGEADSIGLIGKGFDPDGPTAAVLLDGVPINDVRLEVADDGTISAQVPLPEGLERGEHLVEVRQGEGRDARVTTSVLLKAEADEFEKEVESRFVDQMVGREHQQDSGSTETAS